MPITAAQLNDVFNLTHETHLRKGRKAIAQNVQDKPLIAALEPKAGDFAGGRETLAFNVKDGAGGTAGWQGYSGDDPLSYDNPTGVKKVRYTWKEHFQGLQVNFSELKQHGIDVLEDGVDQSTVAMSGREAHALGNALDEKMEMFDEDRKRSFNALLWGDGTADSKALAGIQSFILDNPAAGTTGGLSRSTHTWWRNRAATAAAAAAGSGFDEITSATTNGGALIEFFGKEERQRTRYGGQRNAIVRLCGSDFLEALKRELRANGQYSQTGFNGRQDIDMGDVYFGNVRFQYDPTLDDLGYEKRCYTIDTSSNGIRLMYMQGNRYKKHNPARPYDRMVMYSGASMTGVMVAFRLRTSGVYDIA